jgi:hypothetical protein
MSRKKDSGAVSKVLVAAIDAEVAEMARKNEDGTFVYSMVDRCRVYDRALKLEALKLKSDDPTWGAAFEK